LVKIFKLKVAGERNGRRVIVFNQSSSLTLRY
jgi:hypothetical protein